MAFILAAIREHQGSELYKTAVDAMDYYNGENPTISRYEKIIYDAQGKAHQDMFTANHKLASRFFGFAVDQQVSYLLGNGVGFGSPGTKKRLGQDFDGDLSLAGEYALIGGVSFGFWNLDHLDVFMVTEFVPLEDEENGALKAGIRFWQINRQKPLRCTLYEIDGYTEYIQRPGEDMQVMEKKRAYKLQITTAPLDNTKIYEGGNYPDFPIVPLKNNRHCRSELVGKRNTVDAFDLCCSNMVNNVDEGNLIYWVLTNCAGMSDLDDTKFLERLKTTHVTHADGEDGARAEAHIVEAPFAGTEATIDMIKRKLYEDFQAFDAAAVTAGNQTATAIKASYVPLDLKTDRFERQVTKFVLGILALAGVEDAPTYTRNQIVNRMEEAQTVLMGAQYLDGTYMTRKLLDILGDGDRAEEILRRMDAEELEKFDGGQDVEEEEPQAVAPTTEEAIDAAEEAVGRTLNGSQTSSLITVIKGLKSGDITEGQAVRILTTSIGVSREEALAIIRGDV